MMDNFVGKRLDGRYEIQEIIGVGGMSVVYKAYDNIDDRIVAVKILKEEFLANEEFRRRFKNESKAIAVLSHPNIVKVYDVSFGDRLQYIVMEHIDGITLKEYIEQQGVVGWKESVHFTTQILRALQHAHDKGIVHRDVKPQNIILLQNGNIKVTDFGIARFSRSETRTMTESAIGSVHYISPEQARGEITDEKADIYSAGVVLYEMITGKVPFESDSAVSVAIMQLQKDPTMPRDINPHIPLGLEQITMRAMQKTPAERYQTAAEMLMDLDELKRNPAISFEYAYFVDREPTKFIDTQPFQAASDQNYDDEFYDEEEEISSGMDPAKKKKLIIIASAIAGVILLVVLGIVVFGGGEKVKVPNFVGMNYLEEVDTNEDYKKNFRFKVTYTNEYDTALYKEGDVVEQNPKANKKVKTGKIINLTVANPGGEAEVPDVTGRTETEAIQILNAAGFINVTPLPVVDDSVEEGLVIKTVPGSGTKTELTAEITIHVSAGGGAKEMPQVVGMSRDDAAKFLDDRKIKYRFEEEDSETKKDEVIRQSVEKGEKVSSDTTVVLTVSNGKGTTTEPTTTTKPAEKTVAVTIKLPDFGGTGDVKVFLDSVSVRTDEVNLGGGSYTFNVTGTTTGSVLVTVNGQEYFTCTVDFTTGNRSNEVYKTISAA